MAEPQTPPPPLPIEPREKNAWRRWLIPRISITLYFVACVTPALGFDKQTWPGYQVAMIGGMGVLLGQFGWLANLPLFAAWVLLGLGKVRAGRICALAALLIAAHTFTLFGQNVPMDEGGMNHMRLQTLLPGFYLWIASILTALIGSWWVPPKPSVAKAG